jgi:hypothetical protein
MAASVKTVRANDSLVVIDTEFMAQATTTICGAPIAGTGLELSA